MKKFIILIILVVEIFINYYKFNIPVNDNTIINYHNQIIIDSINLKQNIFDYRSSNVDENIIILKESDIDNNFIILASHSGNSIISYFKKIDKLNSNDKVMIIINNKKVEYKVLKKEYQSKNGFIRINKNNTSNYLYLTTCDKLNNNRQLVVICVNNM